MTVGLGMAAAAIGLKTIGHIRQRSVCRNF